MDDYNYLGNWWSSNTHNQNHKWRLRLFCINYISICLKKKFKNLLKIQILIYIFLNFIRTFRHVSYSSGSKSLNNISNLNGSNQSSRGQQNPQSASKKGQTQQPLAITYVDKAPKPRNPERSRCSSVCTNWKNSLRNDKPERLFPAIPNPNAR